MGFGLFNPSSPCGICPGEPGDEDECVAWQSSGENWRTEFDDENIANFSSPVAVFEHVDDGGGDDIIEATGGPGSIYRVGQRGNDVFNIQGVVVNNISGVSCGIFVGGAYRLMIDSDTNEVSYVECDEFGKATGIAQVISDELGIGDVSLGMEFEDNGDGTARVVFAVGQLVVEFLTDGIWPEQQPNFGLVSEASGKWRSLDFECDHLYAGEDGIGLCDNCTVIPEWWRVIDPFSLVTGGGSCLNAFRKSDGTLITEDEFVFGINESAPALLFCNWNTPFSLINEGPCHSPGDPTITQFWEIRVSNNFSQTAISLNYLTTYHDGAAPITVLIQWGTLIPAGQPCLGPHTLTKTIQTLPCCDLAETIVIQAE